MTLLLFVYGLAFFSLGTTTLVALALQPRSRLPFSRGMMFLGLFGLLHGATEWLVMAEAMDASIGSWDEIPLGLSYVVLAIYGLYPLVGARGKVGAARLAAFGLAVTLACFAARSEPTTETLLRYAIGLPGCLLVARRLIQDRRKMPSLGTSSRYLLVLAWSFVVYGVVAGVFVPRASMFPATVLNQELFRAWFQFPIQVLRAATAIVMTGTVLLVIRAFKDEVIQGLTHAREQLLEEIKTRTRSEERYRALFNFFPLPAWVMDAETLQFLAVNDAMVRHYGYTSDELVGMRALDLVAPEPSGEPGGEIPRARMDETAHLGVRKHRRKDGALIDVDTVVQGISFDGRSAVLGIGNDVTEARKLEDQLRQAQKLDAIGRLASGVAHDFNNILAVVMSNADIAVRMCGKEHPATERIGVIKRTAKRGAALTRQLLAFSRKEPRQPKLLDLNQIVTGVHEMLSQVVGQGIAMSTSLAPRLGTIEADASQLEQVIMNLVINARDAMPTGGQLIIETANQDLDAARAQELGISKGAYVRLSVRDTGSGMDAAVRARIFEPFFTTKEVGKGTGLGLATVFGIVQQSSGAIAVDSEVGRGTTFHVYLPCVEPAAAAGQPPGAEPRAGSS
jgi:PAS domain S-box-containing protein